MATATMATAAALLCYTLNHKLQSSRPPGDDDENGDAAPTQASLGVDRISHRLIQAPATWLETISTLSETLGFTYSETPGKWPIGDLAFGINFLLKREIVGRSLGGGTAALLTYILREQKELSTTTGVTFASAACMTWELAESGDDFITSVRNGADLVPAFSAASVDDLRGEVAASAWINDLRNQIERTIIICTVYRSASALGSHLPTIASARANVGGAGAILRPVSNGTQVVMRRAQSIAQAAWTQPVHLSSWSCMGPRHRATAMRSSTEEDRISQESSTIQTETLESLQSSSTENVETFQFPVSSSPAGMQWTTEIKCSYSEEISHNDAHRGSQLNEGEDLVDHNTREDRMTEVELWQQLEHELYDKREG